MMPMCDVCFAAKHKALTGVLLTNCMQCNRQLCNLCAPYTTLVDSRRTCCLCLPRKDDWHVTFSGSIAEFDLVLPSAVGDDNCISCPFCNWVVWLASDTVAYNHHCIHAKYIQTGQRKYKITYWRTPRKQISYEWQQEQILSDRVAQRLLNEPR